jgi:two-component system, NarL family, nitrate/nitrite response regulator NarL
MTVLEGLARQEVPAPEDRLLISGETGPPRAADQPANGARSGPHEAPPRPSRSEARCPPIPIVIIDKSYLFRAGLTHILAGGRFRVTAGCAMLRDLPADALGEEPGLALISADNDEPGTVAAQIPALKAQSGSLRVIVLSDQFRSEELLAAIEAGADGYLLKSEITPEALMRSLELALLGGVVIPQGLGRMLRGRGPLLSETPAAIEPAARHDPRQPGSEAARTGEVTRLSNREQMILRQLTQGASNKHIARELNIAEATVKVHVKSLLRKIRVNNRTQAAMWAISAGLVQFAMLLTKSALPFCGEAGCLF